MPQKLPITPLASLLQKIRVRNQAHIVTKVAETDKIYHK